MVHPILFGVLAGVFAAKFIARRRRHLSGGGCGHFGARFDAERWEPGGRGFGGHARRGFWGRRKEAGGGIARVVSTSERIASVRADLELNKRQNEEFGEVIERIREVLGAAFERWPADEALSVVGSDSFEVDRARAVFAAVADPALEKELVDGLEHLHTILTPEQRDRLASRLKR